MAILTVSVGAVSCLRACVCGPKRLPLYVSTMFAFTIFFLFTILFLLSAMFKATRIYVFKTTQDCTIVHNACIYNCLINYVVHLHSKYGSISEQWWLHICSGVQVNITCLILNCVINTI